MNKEATKGESLYLVNEEGERLCNFEVLSGTEGAEVLDIRNLYRDTGYFTYDPGFSSTASCSSDITYVDGEAGILRHCGYSIEELASKSSFLEVAYLLWYKELPSKSELDEFEKIVTYHTILNDQIRHFFKGFRRDAHPMAIVLGVIGAMAAFYHESLDVKNARQREIAIFRIISKVPTIAAMAYKYTEGQPFIYSCNGLSYIANFLRMCFATPAEDYRVVPEAVDALEKIFILHADHEQNASTSTVRVSGSSGSNPFGCIAAGFSSLWGPAHGGANEAVIEMLHEIGDVSNIDEFIKRAKDKEDPFRLMGFGHRVYKNYDPRASVLKESCAELVGALGKENEKLFVLAQELEKIALQDNYFIDRKLFPNVDFYSGIILRALGYPTSMFTVLFGVARSAGWCAQWDEMNSDETSRIARPRQLYTGHKAREYIEKDKR